MSRPTEAHNDLSVNIDVQEAPGIVEILSQVDAQLFSGWESFDSFESEIVQSNLLKFASAISSALENNDKIVLSGCGTSGRLAFFCSRAFNRILKSLNQNPVFDYLMAGGDEALFVSQELVEDSPQIGADDLRKILKSSREKNAKCKITFVGITCGLSAPYVAGQLFEALKNPEEFSSVGLIGHNPISLARNDPIENWDHGTFRSISQDLEKSDRSIIITPVFGGETISGSSRMKGGSGTLIALQTAFLVAAQARLDASQPDISMVKNILNLFKSSISNLYSRNAQPLADIINVFGECLNRRGNVRYLGADNFGVLSLIDSSECPPTYGAAYDDIRGFIFDGWQEMDNKKSELEMTKSGEDVFNIGLEDGFNKPQSDENTHVVILFDDHQGVENAAKRFEKDIAKGRIVRVGRGKPSESVKDRILFDMFSEDDLTHKNEKFDAVLISCLRNLQCKLIFNAASTGGHILRGKVARNRMIDVKVTNSKLLYRGIGIVQEFAKCDETVARKCVLKTIHNVDELSADLESQQDSVHIIKATPMNLIIPVSILLASNKAKCLKDAFKILENEPVVRKAITA